MQMQVVSKRGDSAEGARACRHRSAALFPLLCSPPPVFPPVVPLDGGTWHVSWDGATSLQKDRRQAGEEGKPLREQGSWGEPGAPGAAGRTRLLKRP